MLATFRARGVFAALPLALATLVATALTVALAAALMIIGAAVAAALFLARAVLPLRGRQRRVVPATYWPHATIDTTVVDSADSPYTHDRGR